MNIYVANFWFFASSFFLMAVFILLKRQDEVGRRWSYFSIFVTIWAIHYAIVADNDVSSELALFAARLGNASAAFIAPTWLYFVYSFLGVQREKIFWIGWPVASFLMVMAPTPWFIPSVSPAKWFIHFTDPGPFFYLHLINFLIFAGYGFYLVIWSYFSESSRDRKGEISSLFIATLVGFVGGGSSFSIVFLRDQGVDLTLLLSLYPFLMAYAMIRHRVLDVEKLADAFQREKLAAIGTLAASVNHELKNPLHVAGGSLESYLQNIRDGIYKEGGLEDASKKAAETALRQLTRAGEIMQRLTDFAKPYTGGDLEKVSLQEVLQDVLELANPHFHTNKINSMFEVGNDLFVVGNRRQLEEIFFNLIVNACQAMKDGGKLTVEAEQRNGTIQVEIQDEGPGIPSGQVKKIFEPFYTTKESGTGLGLYITKQFVERNKGRISVESRPNEGTRFILKFPVIHEPL